MLKIRITFTEEQELAQILTVVSESYVILNKSNVEVKK